MSEPRVFNFGLERVLVGTYSIAGAPSIVLNHGTETEGEVTPAESEGMIKTGVVLRFAGLESLNAIETALAQVKASIEYLTEQQVIAEAQEKEDHLTETILRHEHEAELEREREEEAEVVRTMNKVGYSK